MQAVRKTSGTDVNVDDSELPLCSVEADVSSSETCAFARCRRKPVESNRSQSSFRRTCVFSATVSGLLFTAAAVKAVLCFGNRSNSVTADPIRISRFDQMPRTIQNLDIVPFHIEASGLREPKKCLQLTSPGGEIKFEDCNRLKPIQQWLLSTDAGLVQSRYYSKCLVFTAGKISTDDCDANAVGHTWTLKNLADNRVRTPRGHCVIATGNDLALRSCDDRRGHFLIFQRFLPKTADIAPASWPSGPVQIASGNTGECLVYDTSGGNEAVTNKPCSSTADQQWVYFHETKQLMTFWHVRCLAVANFHPDAWGSVGVAACKENAAEQQWWQTKHHKHLSSMGLCLHTSEGAGAFMKSCSMDPRVYWKIQSIEGLQGPVEPERQQLKKKQPPRHAAVRTCGQEAELCRADILRHLPEIPKRLWKSLSYELWKATRPFQVVVHVGDHRGLLYRYGAKWMNKPISIASEMKPITSVLAMRLVELGVLGLDDRVSRWLDWWPTAPSDARSYITLRHCLSFTTGFYGVPDSKMREHGLKHDFSTFKEGTLVPWNEVFCKNTATVDCAQKVLAHTNHIAPPGSIWTYTSDHLRIAAAMMVTTTGRSFDDLLNEYVFKRTLPHMEGTRKYKRYKYWNPSSHAISSAANYQQFMDGYFNGLLVSNESAFEMESDQQENTTVRYFKGAPSIGRPKNHGLFGLGWWRSLSNHTLCGTYQWCDFAPSHYASVAAIERNWPVYVGKEICPWKRSTSCSYYFHFQNVNLLDSWVAKAKFRRVSHIIEQHVRDVLSGGVDEPRPKS